MDLSEIWDSQQAPSQIWYENPILKALPWSSSSHHLPTHSLTQSRARHNKLIEKQIETSGNKHRQTKAFENSHIIILHPFCKQ